MPEGLSLHEIAHEVGHHGHAGAEGTFRHMVVEVLEAMLLAIVAVATAWSGYQAALWDGRQAHLYGISSRGHVKASQAAVRGGQEQLYDNSVFSFWLQTFGSGDTTTARLFERRFRPEFRPAFEAWLATKPFTSAHAAPGPLLMPQYHNANADRSQALDESAAHAFEEGTAARENGDRYLRNTILLATVLFLTALAPRFKLHAARVMLVGVSGVLLVIALVVIATYPRA